MSNLKKLPPKVRVHTERYEGRDDIEFTNRGIELIMGEGFKNEVLVSIPGLGDMLQRIEDGEKAGKAPEIIDAITLFDPVLEGLAKQEAKAEGIIDTVEPVVVKKKPGRPKKADK